MTKNCSVLSNCFENEASLVLCVRLPCNLVLFVWGFIQGCMCCLMVLLNVWQWSFSHHLSNHAVVSCQDCVTVVLDLKCLHLKCELLPVQQNCLCACNQVSVAIPTVTMLDLWCSPCQLSYNITIPLNMPAMLIGFTFVSSWNPFGGYLNARNWHYIWQLLCCQLQRCFDGDDASLQQLYHSANSGRPEDVRYWGVMTDGGCDNDWLHYWVQCYQNFLSIVPQCWSCDRTLDCPLGDSFFHLVAGHTDCCACFVWA